MTSIIALYGGIGLVAIAIGILILCLVPSRRGKARCHWVITHNKDYTVHCHLSADHKGDCAAPLSQFIQAGYHKTPF